MRAPFPLHPCQHLLLLLVFLMIAILTGVRWNQCGFDLHFFMVGDSEHFFHVFFWPFGLIPLKKFCLVQLPTSLLVH
jgi:hypothetical protein